ncbi:MAG: GxxExxY protein [Pyrinomonadaceae bacterium]|nr:GxxExxY protein [Pyrinomonadaceae bacterium]
MHMKRSELEAIVKEIVDSSYDVHSALGPGMLESSYEICLRFELSTRKLEVERQVEMPINYRGVILEKGYRVDLLVANEVIVEVKAVDRTLPVHKAQLLSYLKMADKRIGLLINFNVPRLHGNIKRVVNGL